MYTFLESPHLPKGRVVSIIIGEKYRQKLEPALIKKDISTLWMPDNAFIDPRLSGHADMTAIHLGGKEFVISEPFMREELNYVKSLTILGLKIYPSEISQEGRYPLDSSLNACISGNYLIHNQKITDPAVADHLKDKKMLDVRQGYAKCSICPVDENSFITSDKGIAASAKSAGLDVLLISPGYIELEGFDTGFIGGSAFKISHDELAFTGTLEHHPDKDAIEEFLKKKNVRPVRLTDETLFDIGSGIPVFESM